MYHKAKKWAMAAMLASLLQVTIFCDASGIEDFLDDLGVEVRYYDDYWDCGSRRHYWGDCDDDWDFDFDFDWW